MGSSDVAYSGKFTGHKSNFSQTCSLLSQYLKQNGGFGHLDLSFDRNLEPVGTQKKTMDLLSMIEKKSQAQEVPAPTDMVAKPKPKTESEPEKAQMTIFYAGQVMVLDDLPADKAKEIMLLASRGSTPHNAKTYSTATVVPPPPPRSQVEPPPFTTTSVVPCFDNILAHDTPIPTDVDDLPIARKASLTRFLEKRKDRIISKAPYKKYNASDLTESKRWLGLAAQSPLQLDRRIYYA